MSEDFYLEQTKEMILSVASRCRKCNYCYGVCPLYQSTRGFQVQGPSGILQAMAYAIKWDLIDGKNGNDLREIMYSCTTCNSCTLRCKASCTGIPVLDAIEKGRALLIEEMIGPVTEQKKVLESLALKGNSYDMPSQKRLDWLKDLQEERGIRVRLLPDGQPVDVLLYVGCTAAYNEDVKDIARAMIAILRASGMDYGVLKEEKCCGSPARRIGEEGLFEEMSDYMAERVNAVKPRRIVTLSPHCYNTFVNEYPELSAGVKIQHYTQFLEDLIGEGRLEIPEKLGQTVTYHDPCYLSKKNSVTREPREVLKCLLEEDHFVEMAHNGSDSLCCGGGGGRIFWDPEETNRLSETRIREAMAVGADMLVTVCPWCRIELEDAVKTLDVEDKVQVMDMAVLISEAMGADAF